MPSSPPFASPSRLAGTAAALFWPVLAAAQLGAPLPASTPGPAASEPPPTLEHCAAIGAAPDRLACYDKLAGRAPAEPAPGTAAAPVPAQPAVAGPGLAVSPKDAPSFLSKYWELDDSDKRGTFNFTGYRPNYVLPIHYTSRINRSPQSPTRQAVSLPDYRQAEAKFQLSLRTKAVQGLLFDNADLWLGFTQQAMWQIWNAKDSKPFRNSDYEPEMSYVIAVPKGWQSLPLDWTWRYAQFALAHQSNGQSDPLSRSWNRVYVGLGFERGPWSLSTRFLQRLNEPLATDDNPDLVDYRGRGEFQLNWTGGPSTASLTLRHSLKHTANGSVQFEWTYPVVRDQPNGLRWYVQAFSGYAETLTDYNFRQKSVGAGVTFLQF